ncbi:MULTISPECIES: DUF1616 domain-containing protein [Halorussus]|uniref:DUF1616 domain-containing protein n=1 Tax=Halorussus TaxID=1070314 RepID=UPI000E21815D|nr:MULTISPECIES: DUF1616 domain-containing protein [Halorussus]NHN58557.1 DUF1616 domain-containing protein [Halorussus sp. JP-T4]
MRPGRGRDDISRKSSVDLLIGGILAVATIISVLFFDSTPAVLQVPLGVLLTLFLPGYAFVSALFPHQMQVVENGSGTERTILGEGITNAERLVFSIIGSATIVVLLTAIVALTPYGFRVDPIVLLLTGFTIGVSLIAIVRRHRLPVDRRYQSPINEWLQRRTTGFRTGSRITTILNFLLVITALIAAGSVYGTTSNDMAPSTEFYLLTEDDNGELRGTDYPTEYVQNENRSIVIGIGNNESVETTYTVVVKLQRLHVYSGGIAILQERKLSKFSVSVTPDDTQLISHEVQPSMVGQELRLTFLLYKGDPPSNPTMANAYREAHLFINVTVEKPPTQTRYFDRGDD